MIGVAEAKGATKLTKANLSKLNTLAKLLSFGEDKIDRIETLSAIENQLALNHSEQKNYVVFLNQFKEGTDLKVNIIKNKERTEEIFNFSSVILSNNYDDLYKLSLELHSLSKRYAFLRYDDLDKTNNSLEEVNKIGAATLFIPEIKDLSSQDISVVKDIINKNHSADLPKVIICTAYNKDLVSDILGNDTFNQLSYFNMNLGFNHYKNIGLKDYFYNSITENQVIKN